MWIFGFSHRFWTDSFSQPSSVIMVRCFLQERKQRWTRPIPPFKKPSKNNSCSFFFSINFCTLSLFSGPFFPLRKTPRFFFFFGWIARQKGFLWGFRPFGVWASGQQLTNSPARLVRRHLMTFRKNQFSELVERTVTRSSKGRPNFWWMSFCVMSLMDEPHRKRKLEYMKVHWCIYIYIYIQFVHVYCTYIHAVKIYV